MYLHHSLDDFDFIYILIITGVQKLELTICSRVGTWFLGPLGFSLLCHELSEAVEAFAGAWPVLGRMVGDHSLHMFTIYVCMFNATKEEERGRKRNEGLLARSLARSPVRTPRSLTFGGGERDTQL